MKDILKRLVRIAHAYGPYSEDFLAKDRWQSRLANYWQDRPRRNRGSSSDTSAGNKHSSYTRSRKSSAGDAGDNFYPGIPPQVVEDLAVFGLAPPSSLAEVRKVRNQEIKKYHSDKFIHDPEKFTTSKEIMQIYNAAYDRLSEYYNKK